jgi:hypothetical protein
MNVGPPQKIKDLHKLIGCMAALNRFISRLREKGLPFFRLLKASDKFEWTEEAHQAFEKLKTYLTSPLVLSPPVKDEPLLLYIV